MKKYVLCPLRLLKRFYKEWACFYLKVIQFLGFIGSNPMSAIVIISVFLYHVRFTQTDIYQFQSKMRYEKILRLKWHLHRSYPAKDHKDMWEATEIDHNDSRSWMEWINFYVASWAYLIRTEWMIQNWRNDFL